MSPTLAPPLTTDYRAVFEAQRQYQPTVRQTDAAARIDKLKRLRRAILAHREALQQALFDDFGKAAAEVDLTELGAVLAEIRHTIRHLKKWMRPKSVSTALPFLGTKGQVYYEPKGVALIIAPWNYPFNLTVGPLVSAVAAGNCAMLKPSEFTPHTTALTKTILAEVFEEKEVAVFEGDAAVSQALLKLPFDHIFFTGSPQVGKIIMRAAADHLTSVTLELGGKSPTIVDETADPLAAARKIVWGKFANCGQTCIAPDYVYVHARQYDAFLNHLRAEVASRYGGDPQASESYARMIHARHHTRVQGLATEAIEAGANVWIDSGSVVNERYLGPTILTDVPLDSAVMQEEIFGPLLPVLRYESMEEVLEVINSKEKPLALYVFSESNTHVERVLAETTAGTTCVNDVLIHYLHPNLPFGGVNNSGLGKSHGHYGFLAFSNERPVLRQRLKYPLLQKFYPPYTAKTRQHIDLLMKYYWSK